VAVIDEARFLELLKNPGNVDLAEEKQGELF
jgi:hypothetical protein